MSDTKGAWDTPLPRMEFLATRNCKLNQNSEKSHEVKFVFVADGVTPRQLAEGCIGGRVITCQTNLRAAAKDSESQFASLCAAGKVTSIVAEPRASRGSSADNAIRGLEARMARAMELAEKGQPCDDDFSNLPGGGKSIRATLKRAGVVFEDDPDEESTEE